MTLPTYDPAKHDVGLGISGGTVYGWMRSRQGQAQRADIVPGTSRAALGLATYANFDPDSYLAQNTLEGGAGQGRFEAGDKALSMLAEARPGHLYPQRARLAVNDGGSTSWFFTRRPAGAAPILYGFVAAFIETIVLSGSTTQVARTTGTISARPTVTGSQYPVWTQGNAGSRALYYWPATGSPTNITSRLAGAASVDVTGLYERAIWALGSGTPATTAAAVTGQEARGTFGAATSFVASLPSNATAGNTLVLGIMTEDTGTPSAVPEPEGRWITATTDSQGDNTTWLFYWPNVSSTATVEVSFSEVATSGKWALIELEGIAQASALVIADSAVGNGSIAQTATVNATTAPGIALVFASTTEGSATATDSDSYSEKIDYATAANSITLRTKAVASTGNQECTVTFTGSAGDWVALIAVFKTNSATAGAVQFKAWRSIDEMQTWTDVYPTTSTGIGEPRACLASNRQLYMTTADGLYALSAEEREFEDHQKSINIGIQGRLDKWDVPRTNEGSGNGPDISGRFLDAWDGSLFTNVGATIRQFPIGGLTGAGRQVWPSDDWDWVVGEVRCLVAGDDGLYFSFRANASYDICMRYNGRGFQPLFKAPAGELDALHWFNGRLYTKADPAAYYEFIYPASRPDVAGLTAAHFTTGYAVSSKIDLEKVAQYKIIKRFFTEAEFTAASASGTVTVEYRAADTGLHPERYLPDDATITWTTIGTHEVTDGNYKEHVLATPLEAKAFWMRATIAPGASGYPIVEVPFGVSGVTLMPPLDGFVLPFTLSTATRDRAGNVMYAEADDVLAALDQLDTLRYPTTSPRYLTLYYTNDNDSYDTYTCIFEKKVESITGFVHDNSMAALVDVVLREL